MRVACYEGLDTVFLFFSLLYKSRVIDCFTVFLGYDLIHTWQLVSIVLSCKVIASSFLIFALL